MELTPSERHQGLWIKLTEYLVEELESARTRLEKPGTTEQATAELRGQIKAFRKLLDLNIPKPNVE